MNLQYLIYLFKIAFQHLLRRKINLGEYHKDRNLESICNTDMLLGHFGDAHVCTYHQDAVVRVGAGQPVHRRLKVLLVATQVRDVDHL